MMIMIATIATMCMSESQPFCKIPNKKNSLKNRGLNYK